MLSRKSLVCDAVELAVAWSYLLWPMIVARLQGAMRPSSAAFALVMTMIALAVALAHVFFVWPLVSLATALVARCGERRGVR